MNIKQYLCVKYKKMIADNEVIDLDELATEMDGLNLVDICPELAAYMENLEIKNDRIS